MVKKSCSKCDSNPFNIEKLINNIFSKKNKTKKKKNKTKKKISKSINKSKRKNIKKSINKKKSKRNFAYMPARYSYYM